MKLFSRIIAGALVASTMLASPALAIHPQIERQNPSQEDMDALVARTSSVGVTFFTEESGEHAANLCSSPGRFGVANVQKQVLICIGNHKGDWEELTDTMRHELIHIAQGCKGEGKRLVPLVENYTADYLKFTDDYLGWNVRKNYKPNLWPIEAEAFSMAHVLSSEQIGDIVVKYCG